MQNTRFYIQISFLFAFVLLAGAVRCRKSFDIFNNVPKQGGDCLVYISLSAEQNIACYKMDAETGNLTLLRKTAAGGAPGSLAADPTRRFLYAAVRSSNSVSSFRIDPKTGDLSLLKTIRAAGNPVYMRTDRAGKYLLTAYFGDSKAAVYPIGSDGAARDTAIVVLSTEKNSHSIQTDLSNRFLFISCRTGETIHQFKFDPASGALTPNVPDRITTPANTGPRHFAFHTALDVVYFVNEFNSTVTDYRLDPSSGTLTPFQTLSTLPPDFSGVNTGADVHLTPDNRFLYASNRGHDSIAAFSVDPATGALTSIGQFATEKTPRSFDLDPAGKYLYAGGEGSGNLAAYRIDSESGKLTRFATYIPGNFPVWVLVVRPSQP